MAENVFQHIKEMPVGLFRQTRAKLTNTSNNYMKLIMDSETCTKNGLEEIRQIFKDAGIPDEFLRTKDDVENAAWAVMGRSVSTK